MSGTQTPEYKKLQDTFDTVISHLAATQSPDDLADKLLVAKLITNGTREEACVAAVAKSKRIRTLIVAVHAQVQIQSENFHRFLAVLSAIGGTDEIVEVLTL